MLNSKKRVLLVDRHPVFRHGLIEILNQQPDLVSSGSADSFETAVQALEQSVPDICVTDLVLRDDGGFRLLAYIKIHNPSLPILVLSTHDELLYSEEALRAGARGFVMKDETAEEILASIRRVLSGRIYLSHSMGSKLLAPMVNGGVDVSHSPVQRLSARELEVFRLLGAGQETRQIAEALKVSVKTIETYREHIKVKLNVDNSTQLIRKAVAWLQRQPQKPAEEPKPSHPRRSKPSGD
jgi:DNA-binding NarL/FixJ family response regulator